MTRSKSAGAKPAGHAVFDEYLAWAAQETDRVLRRLLPPEDCEPKRLHRAMRYSVFAGGKRLRPALVLAAAELAGGSWNRVLPVAAAVEMVHTYSLIHDDLPAMDDDDLRRGRPTCHKAFDEATAILAGDALLTHAFGVLARHVRPPERAARLVAELASASGTAGMLGGQARDLAAEGRKRVPARLVEAIHREKTAALFTAALRAGALAVGAEESLLRALTAYGQSLGLAFQIADDLLDETSSRTALGKAVRKDAGLGKATYPRAVGLARARSRARALAAEAQETIAAYGARAGILGALASFVVERTH